MEKLTKIDNCFIRKDKKCEKILGGSKSCFIACPSRESVQLQIDIIENKLISEGIEPYVAVKDYVYGEDIFCTKICGKIIESKFCIVLLDDHIEKTSAKKSIPIPNPNVYYEYGFMTALDKQIIPLQRDGDDLAFNIRSFDTIKYIDSNLKTKIGQAIKNTIKKIDSKKEDIIRDLFENKKFNRRMEINGFRKLKKRPDVDDFDDLQDLFDDTIFSGYYEEDMKILLLLSSSEKINEFDEMEDIELIISRYGSKYDRYIIKINELEKTKQNSMMLALAIQPTTNNDSELEYEIDEMKEITELKNIFFGIQEKDKERNEKINNKIEEYFLLKDDEEYEDQNQEEDFYQVAKFEENILIVGETKIEFIK